MAYLTMERCALCLNNAFIKTYDTCFLIISQKSKIVLNTLVRINANFLPVLVGIPVQEAENAYGTT